MTPLLLPCSSAPRVYFNNTCWDLTHILFNNLHVGVGNEILGALNSRAARIHNSSHFSSLGPFNFFFFKRQGLCVALIVLELAMVDLHSLKLIEITLPLPSEVVGLKPYTTIPGFL